MNFDIKPTIINNISANNDVDNLNNLDKVENVAELKILSVYTYLNIDKSSLVYLKINDDKLETFAIGNLAVIESFEQHDNKSNYTKDTIIITGIEASYKSLTKLYYRPLITLSQLKDGTYVAGTLSTNLSVEFKDDKWYSAFNEDNILYCIQVSKVTPDKVVSKTHINYNLIYETEGQLYYDNPKPISSISLPEWCHA